jgi:hypothetical protein
MMEPPLVEKRAVRETRTSVGEVGRRTHVGSAEAEPAHVSTAEVSTAEVSTAHAPTHVATAAEPTTSVPATSAAASRESRDGKARDQEQCQSGPAQYGQSACHGLSPLTGVIPG